MVETRSPLEQRIAVKERELRELQREYSGHTGRADQLADERAPVPEIQEARRLAGAAQIKVQDVGNELHGLRRRHERGYTE